MVNEANISEYDLLIESIEKNFHYIKESSGSKYYKFNNRMLLSNSPEFLQAVKSDMGGVIIEDSSIGSFLFFGKEAND